MSDETNIPLEEQARRFQGAAATADPRAFGVERDPFNVRDMDLAVVRQCGIFRVRTDPNVPPDTVYFEQHGRIVGAIVNLQPAWDPSWREIL